MKKRLLFILTTALVAAGLAAGAAFAADAPTGPITVTNFGKKAPVQFDHAKHKDLKCAQCHHNEADGKYKCGDCHKLKAGDAPKIKDAFHKKGMGTCYDCHNAKGAKNKMKCNDCHKK